MRGTGRVKWDGKKEGDCGGKVEGGLSKKVSGDESEMANSLSA